MSRTTLFAAPEDGEMTPVAEFTNAWGGAAYIWSAICLRYLDAEHMWARQSKLLWPLATDKRLTDMERIVLASTYDRVLVDREHYSTLAGYFLDFVRMYPPGDRACSLPEQSAVLLRLSGDDHSLPFTPDYAGWRQNSVSENLWQVNVGEDEWRPYSLGLDNTAWMLWTILDQ